MGHYRAISTFGGCTAGPVAALENMRIIEDEGLCENSVAMGDYLKDRLLELHERHAVIGDVRGVGLLAGCELVTDRADKTPADEKLVTAVVADCLKHGAVIGACNRSMPGMNNTLLFAPALIATKADIDEIVDHVDGALTRVFG